MRSSLVNALFPSTRQAVLAATVLHPDKWWYLTDLARHLDLTPSSLQRELKTLVEVGILIRRAEGRRVYFKPNPDCPILPELKGIMAKTSGLTDVLRFALRSVSDSIQSAFVFGSVARAEEFSASDVDLFILGTVSLADLSIARKWQSRAPTIESPPGPDNMKPLFMPPNLLSVLAYPTLSRTSTLAALRETRLTTI